VHCIGGGRIAVPHYGRIARAQSLPNDIQSDTNTEAVRALGPAEQRMDRADSPLHHVISDIKRRGERRPVAFGLHPTRVTTGSAEESLPLLTSAAFHSYSHDSDTRVLGVRR
jgi:hypothetical protein